MEEQHLLLFSLAEKKFAFRLENVKKVIQVVEITPLPEAPAIILGAFNFHGKILLVFNLSKRMGLPNREIELSDFIVIVETANKCIGILVERLEGVQTYQKEKITISDALFPGIRQIKGFVQSTNGMILIQDLEEFLTHEERHFLEQLENQR